MLNRSFARLPLVTLFALAAASGCVGPADSGAQPEEAEEAEAKTAEATQALTATLPPSNPMWSQTGYSDGHCEFRIGVSQATAGMPPPYYAWIQRNALDATCTNTGYLVLANSYGYVPQVVFVKHPTADKITVSYTAKTGLSGSSPYQARVTQLDYNTLATIKGSTISTWNGSLVASSDINVLGVSANGDLWALGHSSGTITNQVGTGTNFTAFYSSWFNTTSAATTSVARF